MKKENTKIQLSQKNTRTQAHQMNKSASANNYSQLFGLSAVILLGICIYSNSFDCSFHLDDKNNILENVNIRNLSDIKTIWNYNSTRFIPNLSFAINYHFGELNVWGYHFLNLLIHLINTCLVWWLTILILSSPNLKSHEIAGHKKAIAIITAFLFVSHPLATQSVTYIVQRMASMASMFYFLSLALYIKARFSDTKSLQSYLLFIGSIGSAILAIFSKENTYTLPFAIIMIEIFFLQTKKPSFRLSDYRLILLMTLVASAIIMIYFKFNSSIFRTILPSGTRQFIITPFNYLLTQFPVIATYIKLLFLPLHQNLDYDFPISNNFFEVSTLLSFLLILSLIILAIFLFKRNRIISFGIFWFFMTLSVESSVVPIEDLIFEHRTYLPSFGFFLILSSGLFSLLWNKHKYILIFIFTVIISANSILTYERNNIWKDEFSLWDDVILKSPNKARPYLNRGVAYWDLNYPEKAIADYKKAVNLNPKYFSFAYLNLGIALASIGQWSSAIDNYNKTIEIDTNNSEAYSSRAISFASMNESEKAIVDFSIAISLNPNNGKNYYNRGNVYMNKMQWKEAIIDYSQAIKIDPNYIDAYSNRAIVFGNLGEIDKSILDCSKAIEIDPMYIKAYTNRAINFSSLKRWKEAIKDYSLVIQYNPNNKYSYFGRGIVYINTEQWELAISDFSKVIEIDPNFKSAYSSREFANSKMPKMK